MVEDVVLLLCCEIVFERGETMDTYTQQSGLEAAASVGDGLAMTTSIYAPSHR